MNAHFPLWFVVPTDKAGGTLHDSTAQPLIFSSVEKMAAWLESRHSETHWNVRLLDRDSAIEALNELRSRGCMEICLDIDGQPASTISIADLMLRIA
jgi:hypothetical protein